jgi:hypothetical protein
MATTTTTLTESYTLLNAGACVVEVRGGNGVRIHIGASAPADSTDDYHPKSRGENVSYSGSENVYARADSGSATVVTTGVV